MLLPGSSVEKWGSEKEMKKRDSNQTKYELFIIRGVLLLNHFHVTSSGALALGKAALTMPLYAKPPVFPEWKTGSFSMLLAGWEFILFYFIFVNSLACSLPEVDFSSILCGR